MVFNVVPIKPIVSEVDEVAYSSVPSTCEPACSILIWDTLHVCEVKSNVRFLSPFWDNPTLGSACAAPLLPAAHAQDPPLRGLRPFPRLAQTSAEGRRHGSTGACG